MCVVGRGLVCNISVYFFISENILLSPNPANESSNLWVGGDDDDVNLTLFDISGRIIWTKNDKVPYSRSVNVPLIDVE